MTHRCTIFVVLLTDNDVHSPGLFQMLIILSNKMYDFRSYLCKRIYLGNTHHRKPLLYINIIHQVNAAV